MRCIGSFTTLEIDIDEINGDISEAVVTDSKISIDWVEDGENYFASLHSTNGIEYDGTFGEPILNDACKMTGVKYEALDGSVLLLAKWVRKDLGTAGACYFEFFPAEQ